MDGHFIVPGPEGDAVPARGPSTWAGEQLREGNGPFSPGDFWCGHAVVWPTTGAGEAVLPQGW